MHHASLSPAADRFGGRLFKRSFYLLPSVRFMVTLCAAVFAAIVLAVAGGSVRAYADQAGPFEVDGPPKSSSYANGTLTINADGVTIKSMASTPQPGENNVRVAQGVRMVTIGTSVQIARLTDERFTTYLIEGTGNYVDIWDSARTTGIEGPGSITIRQGMGDIGITQATVEIVEGAQSIEVYQVGTLIVDAGASGFGVLSIFGGTLDLSRISPDSPFVASGYSLGNAQAPTNIIVPFGTESLNDLIEAKNRLINLEGITVYSDGENVGVLERDGTIYYTATRTVTFTGFDGRVLAVENVRLFQPATAPAVEAPKGYEFTGWDADFSRITHDQTIAAVFKAVPQPERPRASSVGQTAVSERSAGRLAASGDVATPAVAAAFAVGLSAAMALYIVRRRDAPGVEGASVCYHRGYDPEEETWSDVAHAAGDHRMHRRGRMYRRDHEHRCRAVDERPHS